MSDRIKHHGASALGLTVLLYLGAARSGLPQEGVGAPPPAREAELRGRVVCLAEEMHRLHGADLPTDHAHLYGVKTADGRYYTLLRTKLSEGLFVDGELRQRELILKGRLFPGAQVFEMSTIRSVKDGVVHDVFYWCDICAIKTLKPGECMCCQDPVVLKEVRAGSGAD
jgi:hypothetical protein